MTVRTAELIMAIAMILASIGLMLKSSQNAIGWVPGKGPGAGAWPFWLSSILFLSSVLTFWRWLRGITPESKNLEPFIHKDGLYIVGVTVGGLVFLLGATHIIGIYFALMIFFGFYLRVVGGHTWTLTAAFMVGVPVFIFSLFEWALTIPLPKAYSEPLFYPIYGLMYG